MMLRKRVIENMRTVRCLIMSPARLMNDNEQQLWKQLQQKFGRRQSNICSFFYFIFSTAVKSLKRESVDGILSKDVNASLNTLFEKNRQDVIFSCRVLLSTPCGYQRHHVLCYSTVIGWKRLPTLLPIFLSFFNRQERHVACNSVPGVDSPRV